MGNSITTSIRLSPTLRRRVERKAASLGYGKNRLIIEALERYLLEEEQAAYGDQVRRQSLLATKLDRPDPAWDKLVEEDFGGS